FVSPLSCISLYVSSLTLFPIRGLYRFPSPFLHGEKKVHLYRDVALLFFFSKECIGSSKILGTLFFFSRVSPHFFFGFELLFTRYCCTARAKGGKDGHQRFGL